MVVTGKGHYRSRAIVLAFGNNIPVELGVYGEAKTIARKLDNPQDHVGFSTLVIGGGNAAADVVAALSRAKGDANDKRRFRASEINNSTSFLPVGPSSRLHTPAHISICTGECALLTNPQPAPYGGIIYLHDPYWSNRMEHFEINTDVARDLGEEILLGGHIRILQGTQAHESNLHRCQRCRACRGPYCCPACPMIHLRLIICRTGTILAFD